ncbi:MAG: aminotransferase class V-fold PLP-dependent enzyme [Negativicutes bacterium]|nr:aminotransferase class V-fold PLP-dependent enzyme [Negativicutes bacterium]
MSLLPDSPWRRLVVGVDTPVPLISGAYTTAINFDNAATTPPFCAVMREIEEFAPWYASVHRGAGYKSVLSSNLYEKARDAIRRFVGADAARDIVIFTKNTTEAINMLAYKLAAEYPGQVVLSTDMEHLANDLPWRYHAQVEFAGVDRQGRLLLDDLEAKLAKHKRRVRLVAVTGASNVTGLINPVHHIARLAHRYGAEILVDGAQWVPHCPVAMKPFGSLEHIDYLAFSAHKMYAPFGAGVLIAPKQTFAQGLPVYKGGGTVSLAARELVDWEEPPFRDEAGSPNAMGVVALATAVQTLAALGMERLHAYETDLLAYAVNGLKSVPGVTLFGDIGRPEERVSLISFAAQGIHHRIVAKILSYEAGIAVRTGLFCAHPYVHNLLGLTQADIEYCHMHPDGALPGLIRVSFGLYNDRREIDRFLEVLTWIMRNKQRLIAKYEQIDDRINHPDWLLQPIRKEAP